MMCFMENLNHAPILKYPQQTYPFLSLKMGNAVTVNEEHIKQFLFPPNL